MTSSLNISSRITPSPPVNLPTPPEPGRSSNRLRTTGYLHRREQNSVFDKNDPACTEASTFLYIWWTLPIVWKFWTKVHCIIYTIYGNQIHKNLYKALLNHIQKISINIKLKILDYRFTTAKQTMAKFGKPNPPAFQNERADYPKPKPMAKLTDKLPL